ncbi:MAG: right-handed parallel beta-helix repeat-containing protein [Candidatus Bathyarchaeia archaeon]
MILFVWSSLSAWVYASPGSTTYYVSPNGDDSNPGTLEKPWRSPGYASKQLHPGDTLIILGGKYVLSEYWDDMLTPTSGSANAWITIKGEDGKRPTLAGRNDLLAAIEISGVSYVKIQNLEITNDGGAYFREGVEGSSNPVSHVVLQELYIHHLDEMGINIADANDLKIIDCDIVYCGFGAIGGPAGSQGGWRNVLIEGCSLSYNGHYYQGGPGPSPYDRPDGFGIEPSNGPIEIVNCVAEHNRGDGFDSKAEKTYIHNCISANNFADGIKVWGDGSRVENCLIYGTGDGDATPTPWSGLVIDQVEKPNARFELVNIAIHDNPQRTGYPMYAQYDVPTPIKIFMVNCIVANDEGEAYFGDSVKLEVHHSLFYRPGEAVQVHANGRDYTSQEIEAGALGDGCLSRDPLFFSPAWGKTGDYRLKLDSPCIDAGSNVPNLPKTDLEGNPRIMDGDKDGEAVVDMGPYEATGEPLVIREETTTIQRTTLREETETTIDEAKETPAPVLPSEAILVVVVAVVALIGAYLYRRRGKVSEVSRARLVEKKYCIECGKPIPPEAEYCPHCGTKSQATGKA